MDNLITERAALHTTKLALEIALATYKRAASTKERCGSTTESCNEARLAWAGYNKAREAYMEAWSQFFAAKDAAGRVNSLDHR